MPQIDKNYITTGKVKYVAGDFPLPSHNDAFKAAVAAHCAGEQGKFWEMSQIIYANLRALGEDKLPTYAEQVGLDAAQFNDCLGSGKYDAAVNKAKSDGSSAGITATPSFLVGYTQPGSTKFKAAELIRGAVPYSNFQATIDRLLREQAKDKAAARGGAAVE